MKLTTTQGIFLTFLQQYTNTLQPTEIGTVTNVVTFGPGMKEATINSTNLNTIYNGTYAILASYCF